MSNEFKREDRYIVFKISDVEEHFTSSERQQLARLAKVQRVGRSESGKPLLECVVVEADWPEYEQTWNAIEARMTGAQPTPSVPDGWQLVPKQATQEMVRACASAARAYMQEYGGNSPHVMWSAMLAAAPEAKP